MASSQGKAESSNYAGLRHGRYKNVERPPVNVGHGEQMCIAYGASYYCSLIRRQSYTYLVTETVGLGVKTLVLVS